MLQCKSSVVYVSNIKEDNALQVQDMNLLHTLVAGCISYREWLERRDMLVSNSILCFMRPGRACNAATTCSAPYGVSLTLLAIHSGASLTLHAPYNWKLHLPCLQSRRYMVWNESPYQVLVKSVSDSGRYFLSHHQFTQHLVS